MNKSPTPERRPVSTVEAREEERRRSTRVMFEAAMTLVDGGIVSLESATDALHRLDAENQDKQGPQA